MPGWKAHEVAKRRRSTCNCRAAPQGDRPGVSFARSAERLTSQLPSAHSRSGTPRIPPALCCALSAECTHDHERPRPGAVRSRRHALTRRGGVAPLTRAHLDRHPAAAREGDPPGVDRGRADRRVVRVDIGAPDHLRGPAGRAPEREAAADRRAELPRVDRPIGAGERRARSATRGGGSDDDERPNPRAVRPRRDAVAGRRGVRGPIGVPKPTSMPLAAGPPRSGLRQGSKAVVEVHSWPANTIDLPEPVGRGRCRWSRLLALREPRVRRVRLRPWSPCSSWTGLCIPVAASPSA